MGRARPADELANPSRSPRLKHGNVLKYETPTAGGVQLDVHPAVQPLLIDAQTPLWVTEGVKKGDALVSAGAPCAIALIGVWGFKRNGHMLPDWQHVNLKDRTVYVVYDSDAATKKEVAHAQRDLLTWLRYRQARPLCVEWPEEYREKKWGVDDFLAAGHTLADLVAFVPPSDAVPPGAVPWPDVGQEPPPQPGTAPPASTVTLMISKQEKKPYRVLGNVLAVLEQDPRWKDVLGYNAFADEVTFLRCPPCYAEPATWKVRALEDQDDAEIANWLHWQYELFAQTTVVHEAIQAAAHRNPFHPIRDYLASLTWDQTPRLDRWLTTYCGVADTLYARAVGKTTLLGAVARVEAPGAKMDTMAILFGAQGTRKSTTWRVLCGDEWFSDTMGDLHDKDAMQALRGKWIIEFGDLAAFHRSEIEVVKRYISATQDYYRPSYGRRPHQFLRQNIFVGSTNRPDPLKDDTGNRRFYIVTTTGTCDTEALERDRDQLWAEALHRYRAGEAWYLDAVMTAEAAQVQAAHMEHDPWESTVLDCVAPYAGIQHVTSKQIMCEAFLWVNPDKWTLANTRRIGAILHNHGWDNSRPRDTQGKQYAAFWYPSPKPPSVTDGTEVPWPVGVGNAVTDSRIGNTIGNTSSPPRIRPATDVTDVTDTFTHTQTQQNKNAENSNSEKNQSALYKYGESIGNIGNIGNKRIPTRGNTGTDAVTDAAIGNTAAPAPCPHPETTLQGAGLVCARCGAALF